MHTLDPADIRALQLQACDIASCLLDWTHQQPGRKEDARRNIEPGGRMRLKTTLEDWKGIPVDVEFTKDGEVAINSELRDLVPIDAFALREITRLKQQAMEQFRKASADTSRAPVLA